MPAYWRGMEPKIRQQLVALIKKEGYTPASVEAMMGPPYHLSFNQLHPFRACIAASKKFPSVLTMTQQDAEEGLQLDTPDTEVAQIDADLNSFLLHPPGVSGEALFEHMLLLSLRTTPHQRIPPMYLNLESFTNRKHGSKRKAVSLSKSVNRFTNDSNRPGPRTPNKYGLATQMWNYRQRGRNQVTGP